jgi:hypothetical protein
MERLNAGMLNQAMTSGPRRYLTARTFPRSGFVQPPLVGR